MKKKRNKKESSSNWKKINNNPAFNSAATNNEKAGHTNPGKPNNVSQYEKIIKNCEILKKFEDEIRERKFWRVIKLLIGVIVIALIIVLYDSNLISLSNINPKDSIQFIYPSLTRISKIFAILGLVFFFLKNFEKDSDKLKNTRRELGNMRLLLIYFQIAIEKKDNTALSEIVEYLRASNKTESNPEGSISESDNEDEENLKVRIPKNPFNKFAENFSS